MYFEPSLLHCQKEYTIVEGITLKSKNHECQGFRYIKFRESQTSTFLRCALFRTHGCQSFGGMDKLTDLFEVTHLHNHYIESHNKNNFFLSNQIKRKAETSTHDLR